MTGIKEKNLPVADSIQSGDKIRIVTSAGNSKQIDASAVGGGCCPLLISYTEEEVDHGTLYTLNRTYNEIDEAIQSGKPIYSLLENDGMYYVKYFYGSPDNWISCGENSGIYGVVMFDEAIDPQYTVMFTTDSSDGYPTYLGGGK